jgi:KUP system potassium uptake protein
LFSLRKFRVKLAEVGEDAGMARTFQAAALPRIEARQLPAAASLAALGIVYGDIGTSPLYAFKQAADAGGTVSPETIIGIVSVILWSLIVIVSFKYAILIMRADNRGEGGIIALLALLDVRNAPAGSWRASLLIIGLIGAALLYGDGVITPAISVLGAVEGLKLDAPQLAPVIVPISIAILVGLFLVQRKGTAFIGNIFGPVMLIWFIAIGLLGLRGIVGGPGILSALSPHHALIYLLHAGPGIGFAVLGAAFLALTGAEAMYADMGHFGRLPVRLGWFAIALPALVLNYFGQGALLLADPSAIANPFYLLVPGWLHYPMVAFATVATIIASQAIISGAYSLTQQAIQLGFLPRMRVLHTASHEKGQIYMPMVNWLLAAGTLGAVITFGSADALGGAYGIAVSMLMAVTTVLAALVALQWGYNPLAVAAVNGSLLVVELIFVAANAQSCSRAVGSRPVGLRRRVPDADLANRVPDARAAAYRNAAARGRVRRPGAREPACAPAGSRGDLHRGKLRHTARLDPSSSSQSRVARARDAGLNGQQRSATRRSGPARKAPPGRGRYYPNYPAFRIHGTPQCVGGAKACVP